MDIKINLEKTGINKEDLMKYKDKVENIHKKLHIQAEDIEDFARMVTFANKL